MRRHLALGLATVLHGVVGTVMLASSPPAPAFAPGVQPAMTVTLVDMRGRAIGGSAGAPQATAEAEIAPASAAPLGSEVAAGPAASPPASPSPVPSAVAADHGSTGKGPSVQTATVSASTGGSVLDVSGYRRALEVHIHKYRTQAVSGGRRTVLIRFTVNRQGEITEAWVQRSSGSADIDKAALTTVERANPLPPIPEALPDLLDFSLPVVSG